MTEEPHFSFSTNALLVFCAVWLLLLNVCGKWPQPWSVLDYCAGAWSLSCRKIWFVVWSRTLWHVDGRGERSPSQLTLCHPRQSFSCPCSFFLATLVTGKRPLEGKWETHLVLLFQEHELNPEYVSSYIIKDAPIWTGTNQPMAAMSQWRVCTPPSLFNWKISHHPTISWNKLKYKSKLKHCMC